MQRNTGYAPFVIAPTEKSYYISLAIGVVLFIAFLAFIYYWWNSRSSNEPSV